MSPDDIKVELASSMSATRAAQEAKCRLVSALRVARDVANGAARELQDHAFGVVFLLEDALELVEGVHNALERAEWAERREGATL
ncbi:MAG: hypothetical protein KIS79_07850 [Burkholderiales bacterium]|nr:hypothetical protein [Burkholderiales bacterium]